MEDDFNNQEFERFLRQFSLRTPKPMDAPASPERMATPWWVPARRWALVAAGLIIVVALPLAMLRHSGRPVVPEPVKRAGGNAPVPAPVPAPGPTPGPSSVPGSSSGVAASGKNSNPVTEVRPSGRSPKESGLAQRVALNESAGLALPIPVDLGGPDRFLTHVATDKPIYRAGERVFIRGVILRAEGHMPLAAAASVAPFVEIKGPKGETIASGNAPVVNSTLAFNWDVPEGQAGGEYTIRISHPMTGDAPAERKFEIRAYRAPRLKSQIVFARDGYGPGDTVAASLHVERAEGGIPAGARVSVSARVDGTEVWMGEGVVDSAGNTGASFKLPSSIARGEGTLVMAIADGGTVETAAKTIPILLRTVDLEMYPEGGDLVAGLVNRVYVEGRTPQGRPADMAGIIVNKAGRQVATFRTEHEGRGRFSFTPARGESYSLKLTEPAGIQTVYPLPEIKTSGVVLSSTSDITPKRSSVTVRLASTTGGVYDVSLSQRGKEISNTSVTLKSVQPLNVTFTVPRSLDGVITATVYDDGKPVAERLIFRQPEHALNVKVTTDQKDFVPGDRVTLHVATTDDTGKPVGAVVGLAVTDSSVLEMIEKRAQSPQLPAMALLESDVRELADARVYLDESDPKSARATDLLLGTQGWRRFAAADLSKFVAAAGDAARRALAVRIPPPAPAIRTAGGGSTVGTLTGVVTDADKAFLPGVTVKVINEDTGTSQSMLTNDAGAYSFILGPGNNYRLIAEMPGFGRSEVIKIPVRAADSIRVDMAMKMADVQQAVVVDASKIDPLLKDPAISVTLNETLGLPLVGNDPLALIMTLPGYRANPLGHEFDTVGGLPMTMMNTTRDGLSVTDGFNPGGVGANTILNPDMISEMRGILRPVDAEAGRGNGQVQIVAKARDDRFAGLNTGRFEMPRGPVVREYAHDRRPDWTADSRADFTETIYWNAGVRTDAATGEATVSFNLSDAVTSFSVLADGYTENGTLGSGAGSIESVRPFFVEPKLPLQVTSGDIVRLPITLVNGTGRSLGGAEMGVKAGSGLKVTLPGVSDATLSARERSRRIAEIEVARDFSGIADLEVHAGAGDYRDTVARRLDVQPFGFPYNAAGGGILEPNGSHTFEFTLPAETIAGSVSSNVVVYPTPLASMTGALQALLQQPYGCFEQTSSTSYPMVMAQQYFLTHSGVAPAIVQRTRDLLDVSYKRLIGFETRSNGYEWFGADPGHEALTAYGLMQFTDMSLVRSVDKDMLGRTRSWLLDRRDGQGGFSRNAKSVDSFGRAPDGTTNAYITWALIESGERNLGREVSAVKASAVASNDSYVVALGANILAVTGDRSGARQLMEKLARAQKPSGEVTGAETSITRSGGVALAVETTALSALAWLRDPAYAANVERAAQWIAESNQNGRYGSTQSTVLALRAIVAYDAARARAKAPGRLVLTVDGKAAGAPVAFTPEIEGAIVLPDFAAELRPGKHSVTLRMEGGAAMPFSVNVQYSAAHPDSSEKAQVGIEVALKNSQIEEGGATEAMATIINKSAGVIPTPVAIVGIPGGLEARHDQLKELVKSGKIAAYEVTGREVILYWRYLKANERVEIPLSLVAAVPGVYTGPASRAYLYYTDEYKNWAPGLKVTIAPRAAAR
ncbi:MAG TPA: carboxypeptidase regulatory-like domain-containing protein [Terriglobia bacterium]|nr:carboxypeptidase regulatory-like domain-containing protein [Terriglobia bacterium]